jgi:Pentapeptide repeats (8 copies)/Enoyl-CoA hydratase/isomerase
MIAIETIEDVSVLRIEHGKMNALDVELLEDLTTTLDDVRRSSRPVVITGNGRVFSAGVDLTTELVVGAPFPVAALEIMHHACGYRTTDLVLRARTLDVVQALTVGLVHEAVPSEGLLARAIAVAELGALPWRRTRWPSSSSRSPRSSGSNATHRASTAPCSRSGRRRRPLASSRRSSIASGGRVPDLDRRDRRHHGVLDRRLGGTCNLLRRRCDGCRADRTQEATRPGRNVGIGLTLPPVTEELCERSLAGARFQRVDLTGAALEHVYLFGARFHEVDLSGVRIRGAYLRDVDISGEVESMLVNGIDVAPLIEVELDRRHLERTKRRHPGQSHRAPHAPHRGPRRRSLLSTSAFLPRRRSNAG